MAFNCGENTFAGTANGIGVHWNRLVAERRALQDANRNGTDTENHIIRREANTPCPKRCQRKEFVDMHVPARLLAGAAKPHMKWFMLFGFIPLFSYWVAQAAYDWDLRWYCLAEGEELPPEVTGEEDIT